MAKKWLPDQMYSQFDTIQSVLSYDPRSNLDPIDEADVVQSCARQRPKKSLGMPMGIFRRCHLREGSTLPPPPSSTLSFLTRLRVCVRFVSVFFSLPARLV